MFRVWTVFIIIVGHFIISNIFIAVICINIDNATEDYKEEQQMLRAARYGCIEGERERERDRQTDRQTDWQAGKHNDREMYTEKVIQKKRIIGRNSTKKDRKKERNYSCHPVSQLSLHPPESR